MATATLSIDLVARLAQFEKGMTQATQVVTAQSAKMQATLNGLQSTIVGLAKGGAVAAGVAAGVSWFKEAIHSTADYADQLGKMSQRTGVAVEELSGLAYAAKLADVSNESLGTGLKKMSKLLVDGSDKFEILGIKTKEANGAMRPTSEIFADVADKFAGLEDGSVKTALAIAIFGKAGADLITLLNAGGKGIREAKDEAKKFGLIVSKDAAKAAEEFNDNLTKLEAASKGASMALAGDLVKGLTKVTAAMVDARREGDGFFGAMYKGAQVLITGDDRHKNNVALVEQTDQLLKLENKLAGLRATNTPDNDLTLQRTQMQIAGVKALLSTTMAYRKVLDGALDPPSAPPQSDEEKRKARERAERAARTSDPNAAKAPNGDKEFASLQADLAARISANNAELESGQKLTASQQYLLAVVTKLGNAESNLTDAQKLAVTTQLERFALGSQAVELAAMEEAARTKADAANDKHIAQLMADNEAIVKGNAAMGLEIEAMGLDAEALGRLTLARLDANLAREQEALLNAKNIEGNEAEILQIERRIRLLQTERELTGKKIDKQKDVVAAEDNKKRSEALTQSINDGILNGFREGHTVADIFLDELKAQFAATVLTPVIKPIAEMGGKVISAGLAALFGFADGGVMSSAGPVPLRKYAGGGVASSPQLAMFGEGAMNEAFVPLPDGRNIPVVMRGGGGNRPIINININAVVGDVASKADVVAGMQATARQVQASIGRSMQYGGAMS